MLSPLRRWLAALYFGVSQHGGSSMEIAKCSNCGHVGPPRRKIPQATNITMLILFLASLFFWPVWIVFAIGFIYAVFETKDLVCRQCKAPHVVALDPDDVRKVMSSR